MSNIASRSVPGRQSSPRLAVPLGSNNPFRNRTSSPPDGLLAAPASRPRPVSTNPFLDDSEALALQALGAGNMSPTKSSKQDSDVAEHASRLFDNLSLDGPARPRERRPPPPPNSENIPSGRNLKGREPMRPPRRPSKEDTNLRQTERSAKPLIDIFADPQEPRRQQPHRRERRRRNSESSIMERPRALDPEEERRRRERRHKDRDGKHRDRHHSRKNNSYKLDIIDKLDVTSVYGGSLFHHDGPFDACNPHRNRKNLRNAPMQAFPKDSRNMALGGAGPNNTNIDLNLFHGRGEEGYADFSKTSRAPERFDPTARVEPIHGAESMGLGTSTFLEGAPASRSAIERRQSETEAQALQNAGLQRKKSLAQKIRGINTRAGAGRVTSPEPLLRMSPVSGPSRRNDKNPFFQDYDEAYDLKGARIREVSDGGMKDNVRPRSVSSPKSLSVLESDSAAIGETKPSGQSGGGGIGGGLMNRMKSLRRARPERRTTVGDGQ
ncbi:hypothetical protein CPC735_005740 [Coccidioides posadasii C735 delta SOWgp]|uniref:Pal1 cell morphology protein n=1 Tax=Coccidioides posadasii (strain C735) TaxID=222929 RepID=C5P9J0_COCP7|nr:hypothetical protein CPC735_005740 [Coccidioides posadasii C735 delta SOWgp]EER26402.1 hypothetical protein CPC735_005740 [Coccidioides posadasii C735 delta SOWgp]|eukprot:XP_003068547.1 hypothetical protein CPC735_005740 [Coccidioides posadasii C735 delta SOWgp]